MEEEFLDRYLEINASDSYRIGMECVRAYARYSAVKELLTEDKKGLSLLEELVGKATNYVSGVTASDTAVASLRFRLEPEDFRKKMEELDRNRRIKHDALISQLNAMNRYLFKNYHAEETVPVGGVYSLAPETLSPVADRNAIASWAGYMVLGIYQNRKK